mgnify:FL=1
MKEDFILKNNLYKILRIHEWEVASSKDQIVTDLDTEDGFIHLSTAAQLAGTLSFYFKESDSVFLLQLDLDKIDGEKLIFEEPYINEGKRKSPFPHLYSELYTNQISNIWNIKRGAFNLPDEVILQAENLSLKS